MPVMPRWLHPLLGRLMFNFDGYPSLLAGVGGIIRDDDARTIMSFLGLVCPMCQRG